MLDTGKGVMYIECMEATHMEAKQAVQHTTSNARLIAAAPELLAALKETAFNLHLKHDYFSDKKAVAWTGKRANFAECPDALCLQAKEVIAKAEGIDLLAATSGRR